MSAPLVHDVSKTASLLGTLARVVATVGSKRPHRFNAHEMIGAQMAADAREVPATVAPIRGRVPAVHDLQPPTTASDRRSTAAAHRRRPTVQSTR